MKPTVWALSLLLAVSPHAVPVRASDECQPVTWPSGTYNKRATPTGVMHIIKARDGPEIGGGNLSPGDVNCRMPGRTYDDVNYYTCEELADNYGLLPEKFFALNPTLLPDCSNIQPNTAYCVAGFIEPLRAWDGLCGPLHNDATCWGTGLPCCNANTFTCGDTAADCADGTCYEGACLGDKEFSTDGTCGPAHGFRRCAGVWGDCCRVDGVCGTGENYCGVGNCLSGSCEDFNAPPEPSSSAPPSSTSSMPTPSATAPLVDGYRMLGCYDDLSNGWRTLADDSTTDDHMTLEMCKTHCVDDNGYPFFGVEYGEECHCGRRVDEDATRVSDTQCAMPCNGDASQTCGDDRRVNVYGAEDTPDYVWLGCRTDTDPLGPVLDARSFASASMTNDLCEAQCKDWGPYAFFGTVAGSSCRCGDTLRSSSQPARLDDCWSSCLGDPQWSCGGPQRLTAFGVNPLGPNIVYQGCYTDDDQYEWALSARIIWSDDEQSIEKCSLYCLYEGFDLFGAEDGGYCMCGDSLHQDSIRTDDNQCDTPCNGDGSEKCGGSYRLSLYQWNWSNYLGSGGFAARGAVSPSSAPRGAKPVIGAGFTVVTEKPSSARRAARKERSAE